PGAVELGRRELLAEHLRVGGGGRCDEQCREDEPTRDGREISHRTWKHGVLPFVSTTHPRIRASERETARGGAMPARAGRGCPPYAPASVRHVRPSTARGTMRAGRMGHVGATAALMMIAGCDGGGVTEPQPGPASTPSVTEVGGPGLAV